MWVLIDNYDSFTYILHHYLLLTGNACAVYKNDELTLQQLLAIHPERIIISPGPETPVQAGITMQAIAHFHNRVPILGVCLGHQALGMHYGASLVKTAPMHGKTSNITHTSHPLWQHVPQTFTAMRYHSLAIDSLASTGLKAIAVADASIIMAVAHKEFPSIGVQFHPESVGTPSGQQIINNWATMY